MAKRTGLGRGIGALIPTSESTEARPVDVFFPGASLNPKIGDDTDIEIEQILAGIGLPAAAAFLHYDAIADRTNRQPGQRHLFREMLTQLLERERYPARRHLRRVERTRGAQHDQILK